MSFITAILEAVKPPLKSNPAEQDGDRLKGYVDPDALAYRFFGKIANKISDGKRVEFLKDVREMMNDGALADRVLEKLCSDATSNQVQIDAAPRRATIIRKMLERVEWEKYGHEYTYMYLADGDLFLQKLFEPSIDPRKQGYISGLIRMPTETMIRNTNERDEFENLNEAYFQVSDYRNWLYDPNKVAFHYGKILHARNDSVRSPFFRYGRSIWVSAVRIFNMAMMLLEDAAIGRHQSTQNMYVHYVGKNSDVRVTDTMVKDYTAKAKEKLTDNTTHYMVDGKHEIELMGGTKQSIGGVDDIRLVLSVLAVALDYPIDLLSAGVADDSGGEELFRKEVVLSRTVKNIIKKVNQNILRPLIDNELSLNNAVGPYGIVTQPVTFEDKTKKSKRQLAEVKDGALSRPSYFEENHPERTWDEERVRIEQDAEFVQGIVDRYPAYYNLGRTNMFNPDAGQQGDMKPEEQQQGRSTPGSLGTEGREDSNAE